MTEAASSGLNVEPSTDAALPTRREMREQWAREAAEAAGATKDAGSGVIVSASAGVVSAEVVAPAVASSVAPAEAPAVVLAVPAPVGTVSARIRRALARSPRAARGPRAQKRPRARTGRGVLRTAVTFTVVPGLFLTLALPAYALGTGSEQNFTTSGAREASTAGAQSVEITSFSPEVSVSSDGFTAVSSEEIQRLTLEAERLAAAAAAAEAEAEASNARARAGANTTPGVRQEGDDYPWPWEATDDQGGGLSPLNYYYRECVDFVAWRLNRDAGFTGPFKWVWSTLTPSGGNAYNWANAWNSRGWTTSHEPIPGAVAWFTGNHVAYVQSVPGDGTVVLEEYNWGNDHSYHRRTISISAVDLYLYPPA